MQVFHALIVSGLVLLSISALTGFAQARCADGSTAHTRWRVAHAGGTAGAVQLLALGAVWRSLDGVASASLGPLLAIGVACATWAFFLGPCLRALGSERWSRRVNLVGALFAAPSYALLPLLAFR